MNENAPKSLTVYELADRAAEAATLLKLLANEKRLLALCHLSAKGEMPVGALAQAIGLSQSALSQHLALLREENIVTYRRDGQTLHYAISDPHAAHLLAVLQAIYCTAEATSSDKIKE